MATYTVSATVLTQLLMLQQQQMTLLQAILTGTTPPAAAKTGSVAGSSNNKDKGKGSRGPRGSSGWDLFKKQVRTEMNEHRPGVKYSLAEVAAECSVRKAGGGYDETYWKAQAAAAKLEASGSAAGGESDAESETPSAKKAAGRPKGSKNKSTETESAAAKKSAAKSATKPAPAPAPTPVEEAEGEEEDAEVWEHKGVTYAKTSDNVVWAMVDGELGNQVGVYNPLTDSIE